LQVEIDHTEKGDPDMKRVLLMILIGVFVLSMVAGSGTVSAEDVKETITTTPSKKLSEKEASIVSSSAVKVLRHIAQARSDIEKKNTKEAGNELRQALALIEIIQEALPTTKVKDQIWVAKTHLSYENTEEVAPDLIPIYASLDEIEDLVPAEKAKEHVKNAEKHLSKGDKEKAKNELEAADEALVYTEIDVPLSFTKEHVVAAQDYLSQNKPEKADESLKAAEDGVEIISIGVFSPIAQARGSFWKATKKYVAGDWNGAKKDLEKAKEYLADAIETGDVKIKAEAQKLEADIETLWQKIDTKAGKTKTKS
jgi:cellobiose-specific phosphotransferase system component IIA